jgi:hypothetical protein
MAGVVAVVPLIGSASALSAASAASARPTPVLAAATAVTRFDDAAVNVPPDTPGAEGFSGGVRFSSVAGGPTTVDVWLSREREVACPDGTADVASEVVGTAYPDATEPGPVALEVDRRRRSGLGEATVDLVRSEEPGCGAAGRTVGVPAAAVTVEVTGTSVRYFSGMGGTVSSGPDAVRGLSYRLSRDGTGSVRVGSLLAVAGAEGFLVHGVDRSGVHGSPPAVPQSAAPPGGVAADGFLAVEAQDPAAEGVVYRDAWVTAMTTAPSDGRETVVLASSAVATVVACPGGDTAVRWEFREGAGPATLDVDARLATATAVGTVPLERWVAGGCEEAGAGPGAAAAGVDVRLDLVATSPEVRVRDVYWQVTPGGGPPTRRHGWYTARAASGEVVLDEFRGTTGEGWVSRAGPA